MIFVLLNLKSNICTHDVQHDVVTQTRSAVDAHQDAVFDGRAEADRQPVRPRARPLVAGPRVRDEAASFAKDVGGASCGERASGLRPRIRFAVGKKKKKQREHETRQRARPPN